MVNANTILESLVTICKHEDVLPTKVTYSTVDLDRSGRHSNVEPPVIEFDIADITRDESRNTERVGVTTDSDGNETGYRYTQWWDMTVSADVISVAGTPFTHRELDQQLNKSLYKYDAYGPNKPLPQPNDTDDILHDINWLVTESRTPNNDFATSPSLRTRGVELDIGFTHEFTSADLGIDYDQVENIDIDAKATVSTVF